MSRKYLRVDSECKSNDEFSVEKVIAKRTRRGKTEYFLKWIGYPDSDNTWEPAEHLDCAELIQEFEELKLKNKDQQGRKRKHSLFRATACSTVTSGTLSAAGPSSSKAGPSSSATGSSSSKAGPSSSATGSSSSKAGPSKEVKSTFIPKQTCVQPVKLERSDEIERTVDGEQNIVPEKRVNDVLPMPIEWPSQRAPEKIIGVTDAGGVLMFLMKWEGVDEADLVVAREAHVMCPQIVIDFYEESISWRPKTGNRVTQCTCNLRNTADDSADKD